MTEKSLTHAVQNMAHAGGRTIDTQQLTETWGKFQDVPHAMLGKKKEYLSVIERMRA